jgi:formate dehydrogenase subunit gamma
MRQPGGGSRPGDRGETTPGGGIGFFSAAIGYFAPALGLRWPRLHAVETFEPWSPARAQDIVAAHLGLEGPLLPILHAIQSVFGCVPSQASPIIAKALNLSRAEVHGVITFYHDFTAAPSGPRLFKVCRAEACQARGGEAAAAFLLARLGLPSEAGHWGGTTADGAVTVEAVYCLGLCAVSPAALIDGEPVGRLDGVSLAEAARA